MNTPFFYEGIKNILLISAILAMIVCLYKIRNLRQLISEEVKKRIFPRLAMELSVDKDINISGLYLQNESLFPVKDIEIEDVSLELDDYGFMQKFILRFEDIGALRPKARVKLRFKVLNDQKEFLPNVTDSIMPHLISPDFKARVRFSNFENNRFCAVMLKKKDIFYPKEVLLMDEVKKDNMNGFTLVEIMIVVAIIAMLAAIAIPNLLRARMVANESAAQATLKTISNAAEMYASTTTGVYPDNEAWLTGIAPPYLSRPYCDQTISGYIYTCDFQIGGYTITAAPSDCHRSGNHIYELNTGAVITPTDCT
jgi:type IV pilus assembly protein PilA